MTLHEFGLYGLLTTGVITLGGFVSLFIFGHMQRTDIDPEEVGHRMVRGWMGPGYAIKSWFKGLAKGMSFSAEIATYDILLLLKRREWRKALPFFFTWIGATGIFFFMPLWVFTFTDEFHPVVVFLITMFFFVQAVRAGWPRRSSSDLVSRDK